MSENFNFTRIELKDLLDDVLKNYERKSSNHYEVINFKLDSIENQTTRTNGRLTELEKRVVDIEKDNIGRLNTCPQRKIISDLQEKSVSVRTLKRLMIQGITIAGIFFTILFGLLRLLLERGAI